MFIQRFICHKTSKFDLHSTMTRYTLPFEKMLDINIVICVCVLVVCIAQLDSTFHFLTFDYHKSSTISTWDRLYNSFACHTSWFG